MVLIGSEMYGVLKNLVSPQKPSDLQFERLCEILRDHYAPEDLEVAERFKFHCRNQTAHENIRDFVVALKKLATSCNYENFLNDALRDQFVFGLRDAVAKKRLLSEKKLTFDNAVKIATDMELVQQQTKVMAMTESVEGSAAEVQVGAVCKPSKSIKKSDRAQKPKYRPANNDAARNQSKNASKSVKCANCARYHFPGNCPLKDWVCFLCNKGHVSKYCKLNSRTNYIEVNVANVISRNNINPLFVKLKVNGHWLYFEVDSGSPFTLIPNFVFC